MANWNARLLALGAGLLISTSAIAQDAAIDGAAEIDATEPAQVEEPKAKRKGLDEIIVTAQKTAQNIQDVPLSVSAISADRLEQSNVEDFEDISRIAPNTQIQTTHGFTSIAIRGLGSAANDGFEQSVSINIDGIYYARPSYIHLAFLDLDRIEILRGPQGTLFGKNSIAGAVNMISANPSHEWEFKGKALYGEYNQRRAEVMVNAPIVEDKFALRFAGHVNKRDGYVYNKTRDVDEKITDKVAARLKGLWDITPDISWTVSAQFDEIKDNGQGWELYNASAQSMDYYQRYDPDVEDELNNVGYANEASYNETSIYTLSSNLVWDAPFAEITFVSGYSYFDEEWYFDGDSGPGTILGILNDDIYEQVNAELRFVSPPGDFEYIAGLFYFWSDYTAFSDLTAFDENGGAQTALNLFAPGGNATPLLGDLLDALLPILGPVIDITPVDELVGIIINDGILQNFHQVVNTYAAFGQATWHITDRWELIFGVRAT